jgi:hypothetical protein
MGTIAFLTILINGGTCKYLLRWARCCVEQIWHAHGAVPAARDTAVSLALHCTALPRLTQYCIALPETPPLPPPAPQHTHTPPPRTLTTGRWAL